MDNGKLVKYGIFWIPNNPTIATFFASIKKVAGEFEADAAYLKHPTHCTLFVFWGYSDKQQAFLYDIDKLCMNQTIIKIQFTGWHIFKDDLLTGGDTLVASIYLSRRLSELQKKVSDLANKYRTIPFTKNHSWKGPYQESYEKYGFPFVGNHWLPHITIASFKKKGGKFIEKIDLSEIKIKTTSINEIAVYTIDGDNHELIKTLRFKK